MAESTPELELFKYNESTDADQVFSFDQALNDNWDKIDSFAGAIKSLSNLDAEGEKRFEDIWTELDKKLEAEVLLSENGYIKFNSLLFYSLPFLTYLPICIYNVYIKYMKSAFFKIWVKIVNHIRLPFYFLTKQNILVGLS